MIVVDGSLGEGGGQILRSSLGLSLVTGKPCRVHSIRAGRAKPGLLHQHLAAVRAAAAVGAAEVRGAALGSREVWFEPRRIVAGDHAFDVGTAGSATLVLQTVLPALLVAGEASTVRVTGGTHNPHAPPFHFLAGVFVPALRRLGADVSVRMTRAGFYPAGGGEVVLRVEPRPLRPVAFERRGAVRTCSAVAILADLPRHVAERELAVVRERLGWTDLRVEIVPAASPGNALVLEVACEEAVEQATGIGAKGRAAEKVASGAVDELERWLAADAPVGEHLADQLLIPMALAGGGSFRTLPPSSHTLTNAAVVRSFLDVAIDVQNRGSECTVAVVPLGGGGAQ